MTSEFTAAYIVYKLVYEHKKDSGTWDDFEAILESGSVPTWNRGVADIADAMRSYADDRCAGCMVQN